MSSVVPSSATKETIKIPPRLGELGLFSLFG